MLYRAFIVTPSFQLSYGGGVRVAIYMAWTLLKHGFKVHLVALNGLDINRLTRLYGANLIKFFREGCLILNYAVKLENKELRIPISLAVKLLSLYLSRLVRKYLPDFIIFHDDVPRIDDRIFKYVSKSVLYAHFPYIVRSYFNVIDPVEIGLEKLQGYRTRINYGIAKKLFYFEDIPREIELVANSTVTKTFLEIMLRRRAKIIHPPITLRPKAEIKSKSNSIVVVGGQPNKRIGDVLRALAELKSTRRRVPKLYIVSHSFVSWYKEWLLNLVYKYELQRYVYFMESVTDNELADIYALAKIVLSAAHFEPFGMSVAEGMLFRAIPIVYKGVLSGPWIDVVDRGKYGIGFRSIAELTEAIDYVLSIEKKELTELQEKALIGASRLLLDRFEENLLRLIGDVL